MPAEKEIITTMVPSEKFDNLDNLEVWIVTKQGKKYKTQFSYENIEALALVYFYVDLTGIDLNSVQGIYYQEREPVYKKP